MVLAGCMSRDMGGKRSAQVMAALAVYIAPVALTAGTLIQYMAFDFFWWVLIAFFFVRLLATSNPRYWLGIGAGIGFGMMTKFTVAFWVIGLVVAILLSQRRKDLFTKWLWFAVALALLIYLPNLIWQIQHEFISLDFLKAIHARDLQWGRGRNFLPEQITSSTNPFTLPLWVAGLFSCLFSVSMRRFRPLAWLFLVTLTIFLVAQGRSYYIAPAYVMLLAAGCTWCLNEFAKRSEVLRRAGIGLLYSLIAVGGLAGIVLIKPVAPINSDLWKITSKLNPEAVEMVGWPDLAIQVQSIYQLIPEIEKSRTVILAGNYGEAGALDMYGPDLGLPPVISGADSFWYRGYGNQEPETVIVVGMDLGFAEQFFRNCTSAGTVTNRYGVWNEETSRHTRMFICRNTHRAWSEMWNDMLWFQ